MALVQYGDTSGHQFAILPDGSQLIIGDLDSGDVIEYVLEEPAAGGLSIPVAMHHYTKNIG